MKLVDLDPQFLKMVEPSLWRQVDSIEEADGVEFICPLCFANNNFERMGVHGVLCWEPNIPDQVLPGPGRWNLQGTGYHDLSLVAGSSSVWLTGPGCGAHFFIENGEIRFTSPYPRNSEVR